MAHQIYTHEKSRELFAKAAAVIPSGVYGHLGPAEGCFIPVEAFPLFGDRAKGSYFWDVDGNRYIDYMCAYGPNVLGYGDPDVDEAAAEAAGKGRLHDLALHGDDRFCGSAGRYRQVRRLGVLCKKRK